MAKNAVVPAKKTTKASKEKAIANTPAVELDVTSNAQALAHLPDGLREYLEQTPGLDVQLESSQQAWATAQHGRQLQAQGAIVTGYALTWLKGTLDRGEWISGLADRRISARTAQHLMAVYRFACRLSAIDALSPLAELGATKMLAFQDWSDDEIQELTAGNKVRSVTYDDAANDPTRELESKLKRWRAEHDLGLQAERDKNQRLEAELEVSQRKADRLEAELAGRKAHDPLPDWYRYARHDALLYTEALALNLAELERTLNEHIAAAPRSTADEDTLACMAADTVVHTLAGVLASGQALLARASEYSSQGEADAALLTTLRIDDDELTTLSRNRAQLIREMETDKAVRRFQREQEGKRPVGRPRKGPGAK